MRPACKKFTGTQTAFPRSVLGHKGRVIGLHQMVLPLRDSAGLSPASPIVHLASGQAVHPLWLIFLTTILMVNCHIVKADYQCKTLLHPLTLNFY